MKVDDNYQNTQMINNARESVPNKNVELQNNAVHGSEKDEDARTAGTRVEFSDTSVEFSRASEAMERESTERAKKISEIETRVREGTYKVDAGEVAEKMLKDILSDLG